MPFESPDIETFKQSLDTTIAAIQKQKTNTHAAIKIQSLLNVTIYVLATRFLEGSVKHIVYNCCKMRGDNDQQLRGLVSALKDFNNPDYIKIKDLINDQLDFDIAAGLQGGRFTERDLTFLNEIVNNRHRNAHATSDSSEWYNQNKKDLNNFEQEYPGLISILEYLDSITYDPGSNSFTD